jgi:hypothetical protein
MTTMVLSPVNSYQDDRDPSKIRGRHEMTRNDENPTAEARRRGGNLKEKVAEITRFDLRYFRANHP